jgi:DNA-binding SARP family transcriptional activator/WD40 repeat protein
MTGRVIPPGQAVEFRLLGPLEVWRDGRPVQLGGERQRALLAVLLLHANQLVTNERLIDHLFGGDTSDGTTNALRVAVSRLRKVLDDGREGAILLTRPGGYLLGVSESQLDITLFERLFKEGQQARAAGDAVDAAVKLRQALELFRGPILADLSQLEFVQPEIRRLEDLQLAALMERLDADLALGRAEELVPELEYLVAAHPLLERLRGQLMLALYRSGRQADALEAYRQTRELLRDELGLEPGRALQRLEGSILRHDDSLELAARPPKQAGLIVCPFKGLAFFDRSDSEYFRGRERLVADLTTQLATNTLVGLVGPSGIGKSSLLRAGVLPALQSGVLPGSEHWPQFLLRPGANPRDALERTLGGGIETALRRLGSHERLVLAVDQLEELFTICPDEDERRAFLDELVAAADDPSRGALVVVGLRADFYGRCAAYNRFAELLSGAHVLVGPMNREELARAIELPAHKAGLEIERPLLDALLGDVAGEPGGLPLLSTSLLELWGARDGNLLRYGSYIASGGVRGAVARLAEEAYGRLDEADRRVARNILLRLVGGSGETLTTRRLSPRDLGAGESQAVRRGLDMLSESRLLTISEGFVEIAHEALLREWPRLRSWLEEDAEGRRLQQQLIESARDWEALGSDPSVLYRGARLMSALDWTAEHDLDLNPLEREFLAESRAAAELEAERQRRANRRLRTILAGTGVFLGVAILAGVLAALAREHARDAERTAIAQRLGAQALATKQLDLSLLLARQGVALDRSPATEANLQAALARSPAAIHVFHPLPGRLVGIEASPDGRWLLVTGDGQQLALVDRKTLRTVRVIEGDAGSFADDGRLVLLRSGGLSLVDPQSGATAPFDVRVDSATQLFSVESDLAYAAGSPASGRPKNELTVWRLGGRQRAIHRLRTQPGLEFGDVELASHHLVVFESSSGGLSPNQLHSAFVGRVQVEVWSLDRWRRLANLSLSEAIGHGVAPWAVDRAGHRAAFGQADGSVTLADLVTGSVRKLPGHHGGSVVGVGFSPNGRTLVSTGDDGRVMIWDARSGGLRETLTGHAGRAFGPAFSPDGRTLYSVGLEGDALAWDLSGAQRFGRRFRAGSGNVDPRSVIDSSVARFALSPDGSRIATTESNGRIAVVDFRTGKHLFDTPRASGGRLFDVAWSPDGRTIVSAGAVGDVEAWHADNGTRALAYRGVLGGDVHAVALSPNGKVLAAAAPDFVYLWNAETGEPVGSPLPTGSPAYDLTFSPDGRALAAALLGYGVAYVWRLPSERQAFIVTIDEEDQNRGDAVAFSPDGRLLATAGGSGLVRFWDVATGKPVGGPLLASGGYVASVAFDPKGELLVTADVDGSTRIWDVRSRTQVGSPLPFTGNVPAEATFTPSGDKVVAVDARGRAFAYELRADAWERRACVVAGRTLTREEWTKYLAGRSYRPACS